MANDVIKIVLTAKDNASKAVKGLNKVFTSTIKTIGIASAGITALGAGTIAALIPAINAAADFEKEFANVSTLFDTSKVATSELKEQILDLDPALGSATELTKGLYQALSASIKPAEAVQFIGESAQLAKAGLTDTFTAVNILTTAINAYGLTSADAATLSDQLFKTVELGKTTVGELASQLGQAISVAVKLKVPFSELNATVAVLTKSGLSTAEAVTAVRAAMNNVLKPTEAAKKAAKELGIQFDANKVSTDGLIGLFDQFQGRTDITIEKIADLFGNIRGLTGALTLAGDNFKDFNSINKEIASSMGATARAFEKQRGTFSTGVDILKNTFERLGIEIGSSIIPKLNIYVRGMAAVILENKKFIAIKVKEFLKKIVPLLETVVNGFIKLGEAVIGIIQSNAFGIMIELVDDMAKAFIAASITFIEFSKNILSDVFLVVKELKKGEITYKKAGEKIINVLAKAIRTAIKKWLVPQIEIIKKLLAGLVKWVSDNRQVFFDAGAEVVTFIADGIVSATKGALSSAVDTAKEFLEENFARGMRTGLESAAKETEDHLIPTFKQLGSKFSVTLSDAMSVGVLGIKTDMSEFGKDIPKVIEAGITQGAPSLEAKVKDVGESARDSFLSSFSLEEIERRGRESMDVFKNAIESRQAVVNNAMTTTGNNAMKSLGDAIKKPENKKVVEDGFDSSVGSVVDSLGSSLKSSVKTQAASLLTNFVTGMNDKTTTFKEDVTAFFEGVLSTAISAAVSIAINKLADFATEAFAKGKGLKFTQKLALDVAEKSGVDPTELKRRQQLNERIEREIDKLTDIDQETSDALASLARTAGGIKIFGTGADQAIKVGSGDKLTTLGSLDIGSIEGLQEVIRERIAGEPLTIDTINTINTPGGVNIDPESGQQIGEFLGGGGIIGDSSGDSFGFGFDLSFQKAPIITINNTFPDAKITSEEDIDDLSEKIAFRIEQDIQQAIAQA